MKYQIPETFSIDSLLDRERRSKGDARGEYNCLDFAREAWLAMTGEDIAQRLQGLAKAFADRKRPVRAVRGFQRLLEPVDPCLAVMQRYRFVPHIGIYFKGRILHLTDRGVQFQPWLVARQYFMNVKYYQ